MGETHSTPREKMRADKARHGAMGPDLDIGAMSTPVRAAKAAKKTKTFRVWVVRHGERADEASDPASRKWRAGPDYVQRGWDPPLTTRGNRQAARAGETMARLLAARKATVTQVFASPLHRAVKTAEGVARRLDVPIHTVAGLSQCCLAMRREEDLSTVPFIEHAQLITESPDLSYGRHHAIHENFHASVTRLVADHDPRDGDVVLVCHREGIRWLAGILGQARTPTPYCAIGEFEVKVEDGSWTYVGVHTIDNQFLPKGGHTYEEDPAASVTPLACGHPDVSGKAEAAAREAAGKGGSSHEGESGDEEEEVAGGATAGAGGAGAGTGDSELAPDVV